MRKIVGVLFISLDGITEAPEKWQFEHFDDDMMANMDSRLAQSDTIILGRVTYDEWEPFWPTSDFEPFASYINNAPKFVVSSTLETVKWGQRDNITLIKGNIAEAITKLKQQPGKNISVEASPTLIRSLLQNDLLDELHLMIHPVIAGSGKRLFKDGDELKRMKLVNSTVTRTGVMIVTYQPASK